MRHKFCLEVCRGSYKRAEAWMLKVGAFFAVDATSALYENGPSVNNFECMSRTDKQKCWTDESQ